MVNIYSVPRVGAYVKFHMQRISYALQHGGEVDASLRHAPYK